MRRDRIADFFREKTPHRALVLLAFVAVVVVFRKLGVLLIFFVSFERALFFSAGWLSKRFTWSRGKALGSVLGVAFGALVVTIWASAGRFAKVIMETRETLPERIAAMRENALYLQLREHLPDSERLVESARGYGAEIAKSASEAGHIVLYAIIGLILAIVYFLGEEEVQSFVHALDQHSVFGTLLRWLGNLADAVSLTVQLQLIVAACNALLTLPVLLMIQVPHVPALMLFIFGCSLIPVLGNFISGAVLSALAYHEKGVFGVALFVALTFILHKIESYYLNPRLAARHVKLPGFVLIMSLLLWEHLLGFIGLFVSFPFLYLVGKIRQEFAAEDAPEAAIVAAPAPVPVAVAPAAAAPSTSHSLESKAT